MIRLAKIRKYLKALPNVNSGGCGVAALTMYRYLKSKKVKTVGLRFLYHSDSDNFEKNEDVLNTGKGSPVSCTHVCIKYKGKYLDAVKEVDINDFAENHEITEEFLIKALIENEDAWNGCFDRHLVGEIQNELNVNLTDVTKVWR